MNETEPNPIVIPKGATHWSAFLVWPDHREKLSFKETTRSPRETRWAIQEILSAEGGLKLDEFIERWGEGTFVIKWWGTDQEGRISSLGDTPPFVLGEPTHEATEDDAEEEEEYGPDSEQPETDASTSPRIVSAPLPSLMGDVGSASGAVGNGAAAPGTVALPPLPPPLPPSSGADPLAASMALFQMHWQMAERARAEARADAELSLRRYEIDRRESLERQRMLHEQELERNRAFYREIQRGSQNNHDPMAMMREMRNMVQEEMESIEERIEQRGEGGNRMQNGQSTADAVIGALKEAAPMVMPMIQSAMGGGNGTQGGSSS